MSQSLKNSRDLRHFAHDQHLRHHAFVIEAGMEEGIEVAQAWVERELGMKARGNPDVVVLRYGLLSVEAAREVVEIAASAPFAGEYKAVIIAASRAYHEAQNALLKLFEEPPRGTYLFFVLPTLGGLLPTLRSRVHTLNVPLDVVRPTSTPNVGRRASNTFRALVGNAENFLKASREKRSVIIKKLASGSDEEERRENREEAIALVNGIEAAAYAVMRENDGSQTSVIFALLSDVATLRGHLHDRSAPVRMILEHLSFVIPKDLSAGRQDLVY